MCVSMAKDIIRLFSRTLVGRREEVFLEILDMERDFRRDEGRLWELYKEKVAWQVVADASVVYCAVKEEVVDNVSDDFCVDYIYFDPIVVGGRTVKISSLMRATSWFPVAPFHVSFLRSVGFIGQEGLPEAVALLRSHVPYYAERETSPDDAYVTAVGAALLLMEDPSEVVDFILDYASLFWHGPARGLRARGWLWMSPWLKVADVEGSEEDEE